MKELNYHEVKEDLLQKYPQQFQSIVKACYDYVKVLARANASNTHVVFEHESDLEKALSRIPQAKEVGIDVFATGLVQVVFEERKKV